MEIGKNLVKLFFVTDENYDVASAFSRWSGVNLLLLALTASLQSCGHCLRIYCTIEIPRTISQNYAHGGMYVYVYAYSVGMEVARNVQFSALYAANIVPLNDIRNSISNFCVELYNFLEPVTILFHPIYV